jgi:hypothetical protein
MPAPTMLAFSIDQNEISDLLVLIAGSSSGFLGKA